MKINWTWWRKRPSVHVVGQDDRVIDMNSVLLLEPDTLAFTALMQKIARNETFCTPWSARYAVGDILRDPKTGKAWKIREQRRVDPDDWFSEETEAVCTRPWATTSGPTPIYWLEDELWPSTATGWESVGGKKPCSTMGFLSGITG